MKRKQRIERKSKGGGREGGHGRRWERAERKWWNDVRGRRSNRNGRKKENGKRRRKEKKKKEGMVHKKEK